MIFSGRFALLVLLVCLAAPIAWSEDTTHDVVVVGAGAAGMYAAEEHYLATGNNPVCP